MANGVESEMDVKWSQSLSPRRRGDGHTSTTVSEITGGRGINSQLNITIYSQSMSNYAYK